MKPRHPPHLPVVLAATVLGLGALAARCSEPPPVTPTPTLPDAHDAASCFSGARAMSHVERLVALGPRPPGSPVIAQVRDDLAATLRSFGLRPERRPFTAQTPHPTLGAVAMENIFVDLPATGAGPTLLLGGHYDGKLLAGLDFRGANDGGSSAAFLLEAARCLARHPPAVPVRLVFFDGEEALVEWSDADSLYGSKRYAYELAASGEKERVGAVIVVDMIGDRDLGLVRETQSSSALTSVLIERAASQGQPRLFSGHRGAVDDDHVPFLRLGIPSALLIDFDYGPDNAHWHTAADLPDKLSAASFETIARLVLTRPEELVAAAGLTRARAPRPRPSRRWRSRGSMSTCSPPDRRSARRPRRS